MLPTISPSSGASVDVFLYFKISVHDLFISKALHNQMVQHAVILHTVCHYISTDAVQVAVHVDNHFMFKLSN